MWSVWTNLQPTSSNRSKKSWTESWPLWSLGSCSAQNSWATRTRPCECYSVECPALQRNICASSLRCLNLWDRMKCPSTSGRKLQPTCSWCSRIKALWSTFCPMKTPSRPSSRCIRYFRRSRWTRHIHPCWMNYSLPPLRSWFSSCLWTIGNITSLGRHQKKPRWDNKPWTSVFWPSWHMYNSAPQTTHSSSNTSMMNSSTASRSRTSSTTFSTTTVITRR